MSGETDVTVVTTLVCFFHLHARLRAQRAPGIPCALCFEGRNYWQTSDASRRENAKLYPRHCEERKRRSNPLLLIFPLYGLLRGACHRARVRATRWLLAMTVVVAV